MTHDGRDAPRHDLRTRHLFDIQLSVPLLQEPGGPSGAAVRVASIDGGRFKGRRLSGTVEPGGADWLVVRTDGAVEIDARIVLRTDADELIAMRYRGLRHGPPEVMERLARGEEVDPASYYLRILCTFTTSAPRLEWLNRVLAAGSGARLRAGPRYSVFEIS